MVLITYNYWLIALSVFVTASGCIASLALARRLHNSTGHRLRVNLACVATMLGATIWVAHFVGMLALEFPFPVIYDLQLTLISALISIIVVGIALYIVAIQRQSNARVALGGVILGIGFSSMHYVGMEAFQSSFCGIVYDTTWVILSVLLFVAIAFAAVWLAFRNERLHLLWSASLLTVSISGVHYFAMFASNFVPSDVEISTSAPGLPSETMVIVVSLVVFGIIASALLVAVPEARGARSQGRIPEPGESISPAPGSGETASQPGGALRPKSETLAVMKENRTIFLDLDEIVYIQADAHYSLVHDMKIHYFCNLSLSDLEKRLPEDRFLRVHRSFIVNTNKVKGLERIGDHGKLLFDREGNSSVPISRRRFRQILEVFGT